jgi:hypothetical protein
VAGHETFIGMTASTTPRILPWASFFAAAAALVAVGCSGRIEPSSTTAPSNQNLTADQQCAGKACGSDCSPTGSDEPFACSAGGKCVAAGGDLACKPFLGDCRQGDGPADLDGDGCIDGCKPDPSWCSDGTIVAGEATYVASADGKQCEWPSRHCITKDDSACPQLDPRAPGWCTGTVVAGPPSYVASADGKECELPSAHCVTTDDGACPQVAPMAPDWCADGTIKSAPNHFVPSADGKECVLNGAVCLTKDPTSCPKL